MIHTDHCRVIFSLVEVSFIKGGATNGAGSCGRVMDNFYRRRFFSYEGFETVRTKLALRYGNSPKQ